MTAGTVRLRRQGPVAQVLLDRPGALNAFDLEMAGQLAGHLAGVAADKAVRAVVVAGAGRAFSAGGDLKWALAHPGGAPAAFGELAGRFHEGILAIRRMPKPVLAAVEGVAAGGGFSLALACDFRVLGASAGLRQAYTSSGLGIDGGGTFTLPRLLGLARALEVAAFDRPLPAARALELGLATAVCEDGRALEEATRLAGELAGRSQHAFAMAKALFEGSFATPLEEQLERERRGMVAAAEHPDGREGLAAFAAKRPPRFGPA
jgi:2-(1,2-epoxy-1,2-dihydrophenyl)acetyl-CoA isomerase